ncbi:hypothetical protein SGRIM128S_01972 [Streptomyces griseomycini]
MTTRAMKSLLARLARDASKSIQRPAEPRAVMEGFCRAMEARVGRPLQLVFRPFPPDIPVSGMRLDCGDRSIIVVEENTVAEAQPGHPGTRAVARGAGGVRPPRPGRDRGRPGAHR